MEIRHNVVENSFRFYHEAETAFSRVIRIAGYRGSKVEFFELSDSFSVGLIF